MRAAEPHYRLSEPIRRVSVLYGGRCMRCSKVHLLRPDNAALEAARDIDRQITAHKRLDYEIDGPGDPRFSTEYLDGRYGVTDTHCTAKRCNTQLDH